MKELIAINDNLKYFLIGAAAITFALPLLSSFLELVLGVIEWFKTILTYKAGLMAQRIEELEEEKEEPPIPAMGFSIPSNNEEEPDDDNI